jgi:hypothetical protein
MTKADKVEFAKIMRALELNCGVRLDAETIKLYFDILKKFSVDQVSKAAQQILVSWKYPRTFPLLAVFIEQIQGPEEDVEQKALRKAHKIVAHLNKFGAGKFPLLEDPVSKYLMTERWPYYRWGADLKMKDTKWWVRDFVAAYTALNKKGGNFLLEPTKEVKHLAENLFEQV